MSALCIVRLQLWAYVPVQRTRRTNAFAAARSDKTAMRPFAKLLRTLVKYWGTRSVLGKVEAKHLKFGLLNDRNRY